MSAAARTDETLGTTRFLWHAVWFRPWRYASDNVLWIGVYCSRLLPGLAAQLGFDTLQRGSADVPAVLWLAALFIGAGSVEVFFQVAGMLVDVGFRFGVSGWLQRNMLAEILTGHILKDAETTFNYHMGTGEERPQRANRPVVVNAQFDEVRRVLESYL